MPKTLEVLETTIEVVEEFKLLGVTIDNKLSFKKHVANIRISVNKRLYSIKRLFFLHFSVKLQFFKAFILPHFDYCSSLFIYFPKYLIQKLNNLYYGCLSKLFRFKFFNCTNNTINDFLAKYNLFSFVHRFFYRFNIFVFNLINNPNSSLCLKSQIVKIEKQCRYNLRSSGQSCYETVKSNNKFGDKTFKNIFSKFVNLLWPDIEQYEFKDFKNMLLSNINTRIDCFLNKFNNINVNCTVIYF